MSNDNSDEPNVTIDICADGPLIVNTAAVVNGTNVEPGAALCRCGQSNNKPYCDGSHNTTGFKDDGAVKANDKDDGTAADVLTVRLSPNGPILCVGPLTIRSADGASIHAGPRASLCRCGGSSTKPFCDGTHGKIGFHTS